MTKRVTKLNGFRISLILRELSHLSYSEPSHEGTGQEALKGGDNPMDKKMLSILAITLMLASISMVAAQDEFNIPLEAGDTQEVELGVEDVAPHDSIGGLVTTLISSFERFVSFGGTNVYVEGQQTPIQNYEVFMFSAGSPITNFSKLTIGSVLTESENVEINGVSGVWQTKQATYIIDDNIVITGDFNFSSGQTITLKDNSTFVISSYSYDGGSFQSNGGAQNWAACTPANCPSSAEVLSAIGITPTDYFTLTRGNTKLFATTATPRTDGTVTSGYKFFADWNNDNQLDFQPIVTVLNDIEGYYVSAQNGVGLLLATNGTYDIYSIV